MYSVDGVTDHKFVPEPHQTPDHLVLERCTVRLHQQPPSTLGLVSSPMSHRRHDNYPASGGRGTGRRQLMFKSHSHAGKRCPVTLSRTAARGVRRCMSRTPRSHLQPAGSAPPYSSTPPMQVIFACRPHSPNQFVAQLAPSPHVPPNVIWHTIHGSVGQLLAQM